MQAGNAHYRTMKDIPEIIPVFPLKAALLLPNGQMPLNIFEPRYLEMLDAAMAGKRIIGMIQPCLDGDRKAGARKERKVPDLCEVGCMGRITTYAETGDGRILITLQGICRFRVLDEMVNRLPFRQCRIAPFLADLEETAGAEEINRQALLKAFRDYLDANNLDADWDGISRAGNETLVNALAMMSPFGPAEKQALLEAADLKTRAETLIALTEIALARENDDFGSSLQ
ncbi:ATP-dependent protease [Phyllobacterium phragmitis]|uniref:ATP-dependent protease n=1 Tax=Phyllobacterium phragmitis TaxID=2670329 RepID=A0A2S9IKC6_9HYPH|nr:LON peptidase substrate-binding domain-containing protein [Phyllobacterium phragmitis]PRD40952.1 ATP-dependent protease [Phyllobacterium phragmitis]